MSLALHESVLLKEVLELLAPKPGDCIVDATLGYGGHAQAICEVLGPRGRLIGFDKDPEALQKSKETLKNYGDRLIMIQSDFRHIGSELKTRGISRVQGALADLGVSSPQLDNARRGFSFSKEAPLDMRMDPSQDTTAGKLVNSLSEKELSDVLWLLGEERFSRRIARRIVEARSQKKIETTLELAQIIASSTPASYRHRRIHPATRSFQAIRMAVNTEQESLDIFLKDAVEVLDDGARLAVIAFHSLEDRKVKQAFRGYAQQGLGVLVTRKPVRPSEAEAETNPRSRSARLRVFERRFEVRA